MGKHPDYKTVPYNGKVYDKFGNELHVGDYILYAHCVYGIHFAQIGLAVKIIGFVENVYLGGKNDIEIVISRRYPIEKRGEPYVISTDEVVKTTRHNYIVSQKEMLESDRDDRIGEKDGIPITYINNTWTVPGTNKNDYEPWQRPFRAVTYDKRGKPCMSHPSLRKRKARKVRRFAMTDSARKMFDDNLNFIVTSTCPKVKTAKLDNQLDFICWHGNSGHCITLHEAANVIKENLKRGASLNKNRKLFGGMYESYAYHAHT